jgi:hypothetical protein
MSVEHLCDLAAENENNTPFIEIVLSFVPGQSSIEPFLYSLPGRYLTRQQWRQVADLVTEWYDSTPDETIELHNDRWQTWQDLKPPLPQPQAKHRRKDGWIYVLEGGGYYKIGQAVSIDSRIAQFAPKLPFRTHLVHSFKVADMDQWEQQLHSQFADKRTNGEWFNLDEDDLEWLKGL